MGYVVSLRISDKEAWKKVKQYAKKEGVTIGKLVMNALELT